MTKEEAVQKVVGSAQNSWGLSGEVRKELARGMVASLEALGLLKFEGPPPQTVYIEMLSFHNRHALVTHEALEIAALSAGYTISKKRSGVFV